MGINALDERHKEAAALLLKGVPKAEVARKIGVVRQTIYDWQLDPTFSAYCFQLLTDVREARADRLTAPMEAATALLQRVLGIHLHAIENLPEDPAERATVLSALPKLEELAKVVERLAAIQKHWEVTKPPVPRTLNAGPRKEGEAPAKPLGDIDAAFPSASPSLLTAPGDEAPDGQ